MRPCRRARPERPKSELWRNKYEKYGRCKARVTSRPEAAPYAQRTPFDVDQIVLQPDHELEMDHKMRIVWCCGDDDRSVSSVAKSTERDMLPCAVAIGDKCGANQERQEHHEFGITDHRWTRAETDHSGARGFLPATARFGLAGRPADGRWNDARSRHSESH